MMGARKGFSLLEVLIATVILSGVLVANFEFMNRLSASASEERQHSMRMQSVSRVMDAMVDTLRMAQIDDIAVDAAGNRWSDRIAYQLPASVNDSLVDSSLQPYWGLPGPGGVDRLGFKGLFRFVASGATLVEENLARDLNYDGDMTDVFDIGRIEEVHLDGTDPATANEVFVLPRTPNIIVQNRGVVAGQLVGDATLDPIFDHVAGDYDLRVMQMTLVYVDPASATPQFNSQTAFVEIQVDLLAWQMGQGNP
jgi:prepilin-type N-terminal cleavage/methylation domain-containing protein